MSWFQRKPKKERWYSYRMKMERAQTTLEGSEVTDDNWEFLKKKTFIWSAVGIGATLSIFLFLMLGVRADEAITEAIRPSEEDINQLMPNEDDFSVMSEDSQSNSEEHSEESQGEFTMRNANLYGLLDERTWNSVSGSPIEGATKEIWFARSAQNTQILRKRYPDKEFQAWKVGETEDGLDLMALLTDDSTIPDNYYFTMGYLDGSFKENAYELLIGTYFQEWLDSFGTDETSEPVWDNFLDAFMKYDGTLYDLEKVTTPSELVVQTGNEVIVVLADEGKPGESHQAHVEHIANQIGEGNNNFNVETPVTLVMVPSAEEYFNQELPDTSQYPVHNYLIRLNGKVTYLDSSR